METQRISETLDEKVARDRRERFTATLAEVAPYFARGEHVPCGCAGDQDACRYGCVTLPGVSPLTGGDNRVVACGVCVVDREPAVVFEDDGAGGIFVGARCRAEIAEVEAAYLAGKAVA